MTTFINLQVRTELIRKGFFFFLPVHVANLVVKSQEGHRRVDGLSALGTKTHHFQSCLVNFLCQLVHRDIAGSAYQNRPGSQEETVQCV